MRFLPVILACALWLGGMAASFAQDIGHEGPSFLGAGATPSGSKPESKLWYHDGLWWGVLWDTATADFTIWRLDLATQTWVNTGTKADTRSGTRGDVLWDGTRLYIASHRYTSSSEEIGHPGRLFRYAYAPVTKSWMLDSGFPVAINDYRTETLTIEKDSTGVLWAVWMQGRRVYVSHTLGSDTNWVAPFLLPVADSDASGDDLCSIVAFGGNRVGVMWSDQVAGTMWFSVHVDGAPDSAWSPKEVALSDADDHINLKADSLGRVYAAVKMSTDENLILRRDVAGVWTSHLVSHEDLKYTRPIVILREEAGEMYVFAAAPEVGGTIYRKRSALDPIDFDSAPGVAVIRDADMLRMNDPTSTKQQVTAASGLVVLASNPTVNRYWHHHQALSPLGAPPEASFIADPVAGRAPLAVQFNDTSSNGPVSWQWAFGDGGVSTLRHPTHTYAGPGDYTVELTATNAFGSDTETRTGFIHVDPAPPSSTFVAVADTQAKSAYPDKNYGSLGALLVRLRAGDVSHAYFKFEVSGLGAPPVSARLRLYVAEGSKSGGSVYATSPDWLESTLTWNNAPAPSGAPLSGLGQVTTGTVVEFDVTAAVTGNGTYAFVMTTVNEDSISYGSREGAPPPELILTFD